MKSKWLLDDYMLRTSYHEDIRDILKREGFEYHVEKYVPFSDDLGLSLPFSNNECIVTYGSISFVKQKLRQFATLVDNKPKYNYIPGAYLPEKTMECIGYMPFIDKFDNLANANYVFTTFKDLQNRKEFFYNIFNTNKIFIRPNSGFKTFTGLPIHFDEFDFEINSLKQLHHVGDDVLILVSNCKNIKEEYRFFIVNRVVVTGSQYKLNDELNVKEGFSLEALAIAQEMAKNVWQPDIAYACDVGIVNGQPKIIELNSFSSSGFYGCDIPKLIHAIDQVAVMEYNGDISIGEI